MALNLDAEWKYKSKDFFRLTIFQDLTPQCQLVFQTQILCISWKKHTNTKEFK